MTFSPNQKLIVCLVGLLLSFGKIKSRGYHAFLELKLVGFDLNLIALGVIYNFSHPLPGQFSLLLHSTRSTLGYPKWLTVTENKNPPRRAKPESKARHFMDSKENTYYFIQLELVRLKNLTNIFGEEQS